MDRFVLEVHLHSHLVGTLTLLPGERTAFAFAEEYVRSRGRPVLSLSFQDEFGELIDEIQTRRTRVPEFFANLLPEGPLRNYLAERAGVHPEREFFLLWVLGQDLPGAVTVRPSTDTPELPPGASGPAEAADHQGHALRFSLAGVQLKFSAVQAATGGLTVPTSGIDGDWIVKLPSTTHPAVPLNELVVMRLAAKVGIQVPEIRLMAARDIAGLPAGTNALEPDDEVFAIKRFDRTGGGTKLHMEDFAQVFGVYPENKYKRGNFRNIAEVVQIEVGSDAVVEFIRRLVFSALIGNADMHLKNWSILYDSEGGATLAPAYDMVSTVPYPVARDLGLNLYKSGTKRIREMSRDGLAQLASRARLSEPMVLKTARETVEAFLEHWQAGPERDELPDFIRDAIDGHYLAVPLVEEFRSNRIR